MPQDSLAEQEPDESGAEFVEVDPSGRYGRVRVHSFFFLCIMFRFFSVLFSLNF